MKKEDLEKLKEELEQLKTEYQQTKKELRKEKIKCNITRIKALSKLGLVILPIPMAGTLISFKIGWNPFILNEEEVNATITTVIDGEGNTTKQKEYKQADPIKYSRDYQFSELYYYTTWQQSDNKYLRNIYCYYLAIKEEDVDKLIEQVKNTKVLTLDNIEINFKDLIRESSNIKNDYTYRYIQKETLQSLTQEQKNQKEYIEVKLEKIDENDKSKIQETIQGHIEKELVKLSLELALMIPLLLTISVCTDFFDKRKKELLTRPSYKQLEMLKYQLSIKQILMDTYQNTTKEKKLTK